MIFLNTSPFRILCSISSSPYLLISSGLSKGKKKKDNLLSLIDYNIQSINQKLNDPDSFYSNYFKNILKEKMKEKNKKKS